MRTLFKYLLLSIAFIFLIIFYLLYTSYGQKNTYSLLSLYASHKAGVEVDIEHINIHQFPYIKVNAIIEEKYTVIIDGFIRNKAIDLRYTLNSECFQSNICTFDDRIRIQGKVTGWKENIHITGKGNALDGNVSYTFIKQKQRFKEVSLTLNDVNSSKLFSLLNQEALFKGKAHASIYFDIIEEAHKKGHIRYEVKAKDFYGMPTDFHTDVYVHDDTHTFSMDVTSPAMLLHLSNGSYNQDKKYAHANYTLDINNLAKLEQVLGGKYIGAFHAKGEMEYDGVIKFKGRSTDFGGELHFTYDSKTVELLLSKLSLKSLMQTLNTKPILDANVTGHGTYTLANKEMKLQTKLNQAKLLPSSLTHTIQKKFDLALEKEVFDKSTLDLDYKKSILSSNFKLANDTMHLTLTDTKLNASHNAINTHIDLKTPKHSLKGKLYARVDTIGEKNLDDVYIKYDGFVEKHYYITLDGLLSDAFINMDYTLNASRLPSYVCTIVDDINLSGHLSGSFTRLHVVGKGTAMEGTVSYSGIKRKEILEDVSFAFKNIHALKLFTLLGVPTLPSGKADIKGHIAYLSKKKKKANMHYTLKKGQYQKLPLSLNADFTLKDKYVHFVADANLSTAYINISKGAYNLETNTSKIFYTVQTKNLAPLTPLIGSYVGAFSATGQIQYNKAFQVRGLSKTFGGMVDFLYKKEMLYIDLEKVSLKRFMGLFPYPHMLEAQVNGNINYDYKKEKLLIRTDLNNTRFLNSDLVRTVLKKSGVNMQKERFPASTLRAVYHKKVLLGDLMLQNKQSHFYLTRTKLDSNKSTVKAYFDLKMQGQEFSGKVYGSLKHPKIDLNMQKLMRYQMDKQLDSVMGEENRKLMESMPMGDVAKDMATEVGAGFMGMFF
jgi:hypothetical protein